MKFYLILGESPVAMALPAGYQYDSEFVCTPSLYPLSYR